LLGKDNNKMSLSQKLVNTVISTERRNLIL
jgi:hypothetical protein